MNPAAVDPKLLNLLCRVLGKEHRPRISLETRMEDIENWDSLTFIDIVLAVEEEFGLKISPELAQEMVSVEAIQKIIREKHPVST
ncbi:MAG: acyl carrier protein [Candidatus Omnitrophica bacterium]|nr:acyl carrier protein [Candidatus Omnitrophota bacterium]